MKKTISLVFIIAFCLSSIPAKAQSNDPLSFPKENYAVKTKKVKTPAGVKVVAYRSYTHIPYVSKPVDVNYQSLNVCVPVKINDVDVNTQNAPILFANSVGGYMSVNNAQSDRGGFPRRNESIGSKEDLALAAGYVVVSPGCRGRDNKATYGTYYGKAPAAIVDLKAAIRYIRHNKGIIPGNVDWIISSGCSAGGGLSALIGASGNSNMYDTYLKEIGAADADDSVYAAGCFSPVMDLEHADMAYEWMYGLAPAKRSGTIVDQDLSKQLKALFVEHQASLNLQGKDGFGTITGDNYDKYLLKYYLLPSANKFLNSLPDEKRKAYLSNNKWITWTDRSASFSFADYLAYIGRMKGLPAFDDFNLKTPEPSLFGNKTIEARHYTDFSLRQTSGNKNAVVDGDMKTLVNLMNPMYFIGQNNAGCAKYWWLRQGGGESGNSLTVITNLTAGLENRGKDVNTWLYWDAGHCVDEDPEGFIDWIGAITGFNIHSNPNKN